MLPLSHFTARQQYMLVLGMVKVSKQKYLHFYVDVGEGKNNCFTRTICWTSVFRPNIWELFRNVVGGRKRYILKVVPIKGNTVYILMQWFPLSCSLK